MDTGPPPGRVETVPPRPPTADAWVDGEWMLRHGRWYWLLGRWVQVPAGATYSPWVLVRSTDGAAYWAPGVWRNGRGEAIAPPRALAFATASGQGIVSPEGEIVDTGRDVKTQPGTSEGMKPAP